MSDMAGLGTLLETSKNCATLRSTPTSDLLLDQQSKKTGTRCEEPPHSSHLTSLSSAMMSVGSLRRTTRNSAIAAIARRLSTSSWTFATTSKLVCEPGGTSRLGEILQSLGGSRVMLVTDGGVYGAGLCDAAIDSLDAAGLFTVLHGETVADPPESLVLEAAALAREEKVDAVVGLGGGSSMDVAKLVALLAHPDCAQPLAEMYGVGMAKGKRLPLVQVPTTAGTGSEVTPISILTTGAAEKKGVVAEVLLPDVAVLDGDLTLSLPPHVTAATGIDAMVHAIEAYTSRVRKNPLSDALAREALRLLAGNIHHVCDPAKTGDKGKGERKARRERAEVREARSSMLLGSALAGMAFANAPVAAVHALAYPLGAHFHVPHGLSNSLMLPHVLDFNAADDTAAELTPSWPPSCAPGRRCAPARAPSSRASPSCRTRSGCRRRCATWASPRATSACSRARR